MRLSLPLVALLALSAACASHLLPHPSDEAALASEPAEPISPQGGAFATSRLMEQALLGVYPGQATRWAETQNLTGSAPDYATLIAAATQPGLLLESYSHLRTFVCANSGQTLSGAGSAQAYFCDKEEAVCMRNPSLDQNITVTATSCAGAACQCQVFADLRGGGGPGFIRYVPSGVTVSGGTTVRVGVIGGTK